MITLSRSRYDIRIFPRPQDDPSNASCPGAPVLARLKTHRLKLLQRVAGINLDDTSWLARLLSLQREALAAERGGHWTEADFFFNEIIVKLRSAPSSHPRWSSLAKEIEVSGGAPAKSSAEIYRIAIDELFIDVHCALYNGYAELEQGPTSGGRQSAHLEYIKGLLELSGAPPETCCELLAPAIEDQCVTARRSEEWEKAASAAEELLKRFPEEPRLVDLAATVLFERTLKKLSNAKDGSGARLDASRLEEGTRRLDQICSQQLDCPAAYEFAAQMHRLRAIKLANGDVVSEAMVEIEKALAYCPGWQDAEKERAQIIELVKAVQEQRVQLAAALVRNSQMRLNGDGERIRREGDRGFAPANEYLKSEERERVINGWQSAQLRRFWRRVGLAPPDDRWDERALKLADAIDQVRKRMSDNAEAFEVAWAAVAASDADLNAIDSAKACQFLKVGDAAEPSRPAVTDPPRLPVVAGGKPGHEPLQYWVFSRCNPMLKAQAALAAGLVLVALLAGSWHALEMRQRTQAWANVGNAMAADNDLATVIACERFFATSPPEADYRTTKGREIYRTALMHWFTKLPGQPDGNALHHVQRYRDISAKWPSNNGGSL